MFGHLHSFGACVAAKGYQMSVLDAFMSTWSSARSTLGKGAPLEGAAFDRSAQLRQAQTGVESAAPGSRWTGTAAEAYSVANGNACYE